MTPVAQAGEQWLQWLRIERGLLESTVKMYQRELGRLWQFSRGHLAELTTDDLRAYLGHAGGSPSTIGNRIAAMRSFFGFLVRAGHRDDDPTQRLDRPKQRRGLPKPVDNRAAAFAKLSPKAQMVATVLVETGLRISEGCALRVPVPAPADIIVNGKGAKDRIVLLTPLCRATLDQLGGTFDARPRTVQRWFQKAGFTPHRLRHTFACDLAASGADLGDIQQLLGHSSPATTTVYARFNTDRLRRAQERRTLAVAGG